MRFEVEPLVGCNFLMFGEKRENTRIMLENRYDKKFSKKEKDFYNIFSLIFENDELASIEFFPNPSIEVIFEGRNINNIKFKEAYEYLKKFDSDITLIYDFNRAISEKLGIVITGVESNDFENEDIVCLNIMKKGYLKLEDFVIS